MPAAGSDKTKIEANERMAGKRAGHRTQTGTIRSI